MHLTFCSKNKKYKQQLDIYDQCSNNCLFPASHHCQLEFYYLKRTRVKKWPSKMKGESIIHLENPTSLRLPWKPLFIHPISGRSHIHFWIILSSKTAGSCFVYGKFHSLESFSWRKTCMMFPVCLLRTRNLSKLSQITIVEPSVLHKCEPGLGEVPSWLMSTTTGRSQASVNPVVDDVSFDKFQFQVSPTNPTSIPACPLIKC